VKNSTRHKIKIKDWFEVDTESNLANRIINLGWCFGIAAVLAALPGVITAIAQALK
jgi:hypothetical protein